ncbi:protein YgfX [Nitrincola sp. MINF-07-Sa-05]|uniref:protein YgfX n=1 Tax=Nitrincola salilacus TaxID=3400273 RepID=UPI0039180BAC
MIGFSPLHVKCEPSRIMAAGVVTAHVVALACLIFSDISRFVLISGALVLLLSMLSILSGSALLKPLRLHSLKWDLDTRRMQLIDTDAVSHDVACIRRIAITPYLLVLCVKRDQRRLSDWLIIASDSVDSETFRRLRVALSLAPAVELPSRDS